MANPKRTALLIRCSVEEAEAVRAAARRQYRTLSGYVMHALNNRLEIEARLHEQNLAIAAAHRQAAKQKAEQK